MMKKNVLLYVLLVFLVVVNGFFLFNYLGGSNKIESKNGPRGKDPANFIVKELNFSEDQMFQFEILGREHHHEMRRIGHNIKELKETLFNHIYDESLNEKTIDSITSLIGEEVKKRDIETFYHFKDIEALCNEKQKGKFKKIITEALHKGGRHEQRPPLRRGDDDHRPPPPRH
ncbi:hypothetical protein Q4Q34_13175 [Flavivirga abyssicola]|uniref:Spy/CpxP family protein refolding chaperone n=1 Tax=Flavivirga abyssicola TaxID=3063533 RepID=UPI0026E02805|nr:hypothetical protein [Flavivirga sp. MEBiC07777]WVK12171.1 hypothetical protein Q4Q34_13175 [Flavivirga sp. MEBiC07777]